MMLSDEGRGWSDSGMAERPTAGGTKWSRRERPNNQSTNIFLFADSPSNHYIFRYGK